MKNYNKQQTGNPVNEIFVNVWKPDNKYTPEGQVEIWTSRGRSITMTGREFLDFVLPILQDVQGEIKPMEPVA